MTEPATPKPFFTRRRVIAGALVLSVIVAVMGLGFGAFERKPDRALELKFVRFGQSDDGKVETGVFLLINHSTRPFWFPWSSNAGSMRTENMPRAASRERDRFLFWPSGGSFYMLKPSCTQTCSMLLPMDGKPGRAEVHGQLLPTHIPAPLQFFRKIWWKVRPPSLHAAWAVSDQRIQCPKLLPDGTVEPPRLLSAPGVKP